ncbi:MAG: hypothetical protein MUF15_21580 [Acidobacteria bacterium]|jgi:hypothetical protein|nr:hypothetical protein [Acidobacteriota bacterium]
MTIFKRKNGFKQFLALLIVFTFISPGALSAQKKKHGAWITVTRQDGHLVEGELLKVNENEILLMSCSESGNTIPIGEIKMIEYEKKGKFLTGAVIGLGISVLAGGLIGAKLESEGVGFFGGALIYGGLFGAPSGLLFGLISSNTKKHKTYYFENASQHQVSMNLLKLKALARF